MNIVTVISMLLITTLASSIGALAFKKAMNDMPTLTVGNVLTSFWAWVGVILYIASAVANIFLLKGMDMTVVYPMTGFSYVWTIIISYFIFKEKITWQKMLAMVLVIAGIYVISM